MKIEFEIQDIVCGNWIIKNVPTQRKKDYDYLSTIVYKIGFIMGKDKGYCLISALTDGMCLVYETKEEILRVLNETPYRPLLQDELAEIILARGNKTFYSK